MAQKAKVLAIKPDRPSLIPRTHTARENWLSHIVLWRQCNVASVLETKVSIVFKNQFYFQILFTQYGRGASLLWVFPFKSPKALFTSLDFWLFHCQLRSGTICLPLLQWHQRGKCPRMKKPRAVNSSTKEGAGVSQPSDNLPHRHPIQMAFPCPS